MEAILAESALYNEPNKELTMKADAVVIQAGLSLRLPVVVEKERTVLHWEFETKSYDIAFSIVDLKTGQECLPNMIYSPDIKQRGTFTFKEAGDYAVVWDNSHSWLREKSLEYSITIVVPEPDYLEKSALALKIYTELKKEKEKREEIALQLGNVESVKEQIMHSHGTYMMNLSEINNELSDIDNRTSVVEDALHAVEAREEGVYSEYRQILGMAVFFVERDRVFSCLAGVDLLRLGCVNSLLHTAVREDAVWQRVFYQEEPEELAELLQNPWVDAKYRLLNPQPTEGGKTAVEKEEKVQIKDLTLVYKITEKQGWYKNGEDVCYFIKFKDATKKRYSVFYAPISFEELDSIIRQTLKSRVLIPMPGTEAGQSGFYIDRFRRVSKWKIEEGADGKEKKWTEVDV